jgi:hypothetical protein
MRDVDGTATSTSGTVVNRRALLRASGVVAGIAGVGGLAAAEAPAAAAAAGSPVLMGATNDAGTASTAVTTDADGPALRLSNTGAGAALRLAPDTTYPRITHPGDLRFIGPDLVFAHGEGDGTLGSVFTSHNAARLVAVRPTRIMDTRTGRATADHDAAGRVIGGHTIDIDLGASAVFHGYAFFANLTVTQPAADGYLTLWPSGTRPGTSTLNYSAGQTVANFCLSGLHQDTVRLYVKSTTHVLLDVVAFVVGSPSDINDSLEPAPWPDPSSLGGPARKAPAWWTAKNG